MKIFITGGAGLIGGAVAAHLMERGDEVHLTDLAPETDAPHSTYTVCDIMDFEAVREQVRGCDAIVHMAALRSPMTGPGHDVFRINTVGTFNVFDAAAKEGIKRVVQASSINAIGCAWNIADFTPLYLPIDEDQPRVTTDPYSLSKQHVEDLGDYFWRRDGISSVALRFPGVYRAEQRRDTPWIERRQRMRDFLDHFVALPEAEQERQMALAREHCLAFRAQRLLEYPETKWRAPVVEGVDEYLMHAYVFDRFNLWASLDVRDAALSIEKSLTASYEGSHNLFINDTHNTLGYDSETLARLFFPEVKARKHPLTGDEALISGERARDLIGFEPQYSLIGEDHA
jgi:nucleoside-diphosphate-sugar epimerase